MYIYPYTDISGKVLLYFAILKKQFIYVIIRTFKLHKNNRDLTFVQKMPSLQCATQFMIIISRYYCCIYVTKSD